MTLYFKRLFVFCTTMTVQYLLLSAVTGSLIIQQWHPFITTLGFLLSVTIASYTAYEIKR